MKQSIEKNRAITLRAALEALRYSSSALIEMLDTTINDADEATCDQKVAALGGGENHLIQVLDDALDSFVLERNAYIREVGLEWGDASYKVK